MDLASELAAKLAKKASTKSNDDMLEQKLPVIPPPVTHEPVKGLVKPKEQINKPTKSLFDDSDESETDDLFKTSKPNRTESKVKSLFDDDKKEIEETFEDKEDETEVNKEIPIEKPKPNLPSGAQSIFGGNLQSDLKKQLKIRSGLFDSSGDDEENEKQPEPLPKPKDESKQQPQAKNVVAQSKPDTKKKISLFDDDDNDDKEDDLFSSASKLPQTNKSIKKVTSLFDDENESDIKQETKSAAKESSESSKIINNKSLFDDEEEDLFESTKKTEVLKVTAAASKEVPKTKSLFDDDDDDKEEPILSKTASNQSNLQIEVQTKAPLISDENTQETNKKTETPKPTYQSQTKSLFSSDEDDLFSTTKKPLILNKNQKSDNLFAELSKKIEKPMVSTKSVLSDSLIKSNSEASEAIIEPTKEVKESISSQSTKTEVKPKNPLLFDSPGDDDDLFTFKTNPKEPITTQKGLKNQEKLSIFSDSTEDDDIFTSKQKILTQEPKEETTVSTKLKNPLLFDSNEDDDDIFAPKYNVVKKDITKEEITKEIKIEDSNSLASKISQKIEENLSKTISHSPITFPPSDYENDSETDDFSTPKPKHEAEKESPNIKSVSKLNDKITINPAALQPGAKPPPELKIKENESNEEKPKENVESVVKNIRNSAFINPAALLPGARPTLPKLIKQSDASTHNLHEENSPNEVKKQKDSNDMFDLDVDRTFNDQSVRSVQKDRLKVAQKKRPPTNRRSNINENSDLFGSESIETKSEFNERKKEEPKITPSKELFTKATSEDELFVTKDNQKPQQQKNNLDSIFADDTDLFTDSDLFAKPTKKPTETVKEVKEVKKSKPRVDFDDGKINILNNS
jgi:hypothetical protein